MRSAAFCDGGMYRTFGSLAYSRQFSCSKAATAHQYRKEQKRVWLNHGAAYTWTKRLRSPLSLEAKHHCTATLPVSRSLTYVSIFVRTRSAGQTMTNALWPTPATGLFSCCVRSP